MLRSSLVVLLAVGTVALGGCRAAPVSMGTMIVGDVVGDNDIKNKEDRLRGRGIQVSDAWLGPRSETFVDMNNPEREFILYPVKSDMLGTSRYVVEVNRGIVTTISKQKKNADGVEDALKTSNLRADIIGKSPAECVALGNLGEPLIILRSRDNGEQVGIYDVSNFTNLRGARYCILRFDFDRQCRDVFLVGVVGSMVANPIKG